MFRGLTKEDLNRIIDIELAKVKGRLKDKELDLELTAEAKDFLIEKGTSLEYGARPLRRAIEQHLEGPLAEDLLRGTPMGTASLVLLAVQGFVWSQRRYLATRSFEVLWLGFALTAAIAAVVTWCAISFAYRTPLSPWPGAMQYLLSVAVFPLIAFFLLRIERGMARAPT